MGRLAPERWQGFALPAVLIAMMWALIAIPARSRRIITDATVRDDAHLVYALGFILGMVVGLSMVYAVGVPGRRAAPQQDASEPVAGRNL